MQTFEKTKKIAVNSWRSVVVTNIFGVSILHVVQPTGNVVMNLVTSLYLKHQKKTIKQRF